MILIHSGVFIAANEGLILNTFAPGFLLKVPSPPDVHKIVNYWSVIVKALNAFVFKVQIIVMHRNTCTIYSECVCVCVGLSSACSMSCGAGGPSL